MEKNWIKNYVVFHNTLTFNKCYGCRKYNLISIIVKINLDISNLYLINGDDDTTIDLFKEFDNEKIGEYYHFYCYNTYFSGMTYYLKLYDLEVYYFVEQFFSKKMYDGCEIFSVPKQIEFNNIHEFYDIISLSKYKNLNLSKYFEIITNEFIYIYLSLDKLGYPNEIRDIILQFSNHKKIYTVYT